MTPKDITRATERIARALEISNMPNIAEYVRVLAEGAIELSVKARRDALTECLSIVHASETVGQIENAVVSRIEEMDE